MHTLDQAFLYLGENRYSQALACFSQLVEAQPEQPELWFRIGQCQEALNDIPAAIQAYRHCVVLDSEYWQAWQQLGILYAEQEQHLEAVPCYRRAHHLAPDQAEIAYNLGQSLLALQQIDKAVLAFEAALIADPGLSLAWIQLAWLHSDHHDLSEAIRCFEQALAIEPDKDQLPQLLLELGILYAASEDYHSASEVFSEAVRLAPGSYDAWLSLGLAQGDCEHLDKARETFLGATAVSPNRTEAWSRLGHIYLELNQLKQALEAFQRCQELEPEVAEHWHDLGETWTQLQQFEQARLAHLQGVTLNPDNARGWFQLAQASQSAGAQQQAQSALQTALRLDPRVRAAAALDAVLVSLLEGLPQLI